jgi:Spy/CpxP family protein refolding chaperone
MRFKSVITVAAIAVLATAVSLLAQQPGGQQGGRGRGGPPGGGFFGGGGFGQSRMSLLQIEAVQKELELAEEQIAEIRKVNEELRAKYPFPGGGRGGPGGGRGGDGQRGPGRGGNNNQGGLTVPVQWYFVQAQNQQGQGQGQGRGRGGGPQLTDEQRAEFEKQRLERTREEKAKLAEILLPHQLKRLTEIFIQQSGVNALQDDDIAKELNISDAQKAKLAEVRRQNDEARGALMRELFQGGGGGGGDRDANRAKFDEMRKTADAKMLAVLTSDQQKKFEEMKGKPFEMPEGAGRGGFGGGQGGKGGRGNRGGNNNN